MRIALLAFLLATPAIARPVAVSDFGATAEGRHAKLYSLTNGHGLTVRFTDLGGIITAIDAPDARGRTADVVLGFRDAGEYQAKDSNYFFGTPVGRFANRIAGAAFTLDGTTYRMKPNNGANLLHGGPPFYHERWWAVEPFDRGRESGAVLTLVSPDGDQGFPGAVTLRMTYTLTERNELRIEYAATTTRPTVVNFTNHSYFNLAGEGSGDVSAQTIQILGDRIVELGPDAIPTGRILPVVGPFDLRKPRPIGEGIVAIKAAGGSGYDHPWLFKGSVRPVLVARAADPASGRTMDVLTTEPSMQFYTANSTWGTDAGPSGQVYRRHGGFALETQHVPDSPNQPAFPTTVLRPGQTYRSTTIYRFGAERPKAPSPR